MTQAHGQIIRERTGVLPRSSTSEIWTLVEESLREHPNSDRILEILKLLCERGLTQKEVARYLGISEARVSEILGDVRERITGDRKPGRGDGKADDPGHLMGGTK